MCTCSQAVQPTLEYTWLKAFLYLDFAVPFSAELADMAKHIVLPWVHFSASWDFLPAGQKRLGEATSRGKDFLVLINCGEACRSGAGLRAIQAPSCHT